MTTSVIDTLKARRAGASEGNRDYNIVCNGEDVMIVRESDVDALPSSVRLVGRILLQTIAGVESEIGLVDERAHGILLTASSVRYAVVAEGDADRLVAYGYVPVSKD